MVDPQKHHRRSMRLQGYDYTQPGAYFITLVSYQRECIFGQIVHGKIQLSPLGEIIREEWLRSNAIRREICLNEDEFIIMPNHVHGIVWIVDAVRADGVRPPGEEGATDGGYPADEGARRAPLPRAPQSHRYVPVGADGVCPADGGGGVRPPDDDGGRPRPGEEGATDEGFPADEGARRAPQPGFFRRPRSVSSFLAGVKASVTRRAQRELGIGGIWQRNYYDHIIRNRADFERIWIYIDANPQRWQEDQLHPAAPPNPFNRD